MGSKKNHSFDRVINSQNPHPKSVLQYNKGAGVAPRMQAPDGAVVEKLKDDPDAKMAYLKNFQAPQATPDNPLFEPLDFAIDKGMQGASQAIGDNIQQAAQQVVQQPVQQPVHTWDNPPPAPPVPTEHQAAVRALMAKAEAERAERADKAQRGKFARAVTRPEAGMGAIAQGMEERPRGRKFSRAERPSARNMPTPNASSALEGGKFNRSRRPIDTIPAGSNINFGMRPAPRHRSGKGHR